VQLAKALGLYVVGVAGPSNVEWVKQQLGADEVLDYSKQVGAAPVLVAVWRQLHC
jgi:NADPH-dependent curcumin reductase CurA